MKRDILNLGSSLWDCQLSRKIAKQHHGSACNKNTDPRGMDCHIVSNAIQGDMDWRNVSGTYPG